MMSKLKSIVVAGALLVGCNAAWAEKFSVGYSAAGLIDELQITWSKSVKGAVEKAGGRITVVDSRNEVSKQLADIEDLLVGGIDILVINPVDEAGIGPAVAAANDAGVPVVTIDRNGGAGNIRARVGFDNYRAGYEAGKFIAKRHGGKGKVAQLQGQAGGADVRDRGKGFVDAISEFPGMKIVAAPFTDWNTARALAATEDILLANPDIVGIWGHSDAIIMGAVEALKNKGKFHQVTTVGMGMYAGGPKAIRDGSLDASWYLYPDKLGSIAADVVLKIHRGEKVDAFVRTPMTFVTSENISEFK